MPPLRARNTRSRPEWESYRLDHLSNHARRDAALVTTYKDIFPGVVVADLHLRYLVKFLMTLATEDIDIPEGLHPGYIREREEREKQKEVTDKLLIGLVRDRGSFSLTYLTVKR